VGYSSVLCEVCLACCSSCKLSYKWSFSYPVSWPWGSVETSSSYLLAPVQITFPELNVRAVVMSSLLRFGCCPTSHKNTDLCQTWIVYWTLAPGPMDQGCRLDSGARWTSTPSQNVAEFFFFFFKDLFIICKYTVVVFRHTRRGRQISLWMVVSHHVVAGIRTRDLWKSSQCS
jgi:hypothetical protein